MEVNKTKTYWIEKIEYPEVHCIPYGNYDDKEDALQGFMDCVESVKEDKTTCVALYEVEDDYDTRIRFYDEGKITNEEEVYDCEQTDICIMCGNDFVIGETGNELGFCCSCSSNKNFPYDLNKYYEDYDNGKVIFKGFETMDRGILEHYKTK